MERQPDRRGAGHQHPDDRANAMPRLPISLDVTVVWWSIWTSVASGG